MSRAWCVMRFATVWFRPRNKPHLARSSAPPERLISVDSAAPLRERRIDPVWRAPHSLRGTGGQYPTVIVGGHEQEKTSARPWRSLGSLGVPPNSRRQGRAVAGRGEGARNDELGSVPVLFPRFDGFNRVRRNDRMPGRTGC